MQTSHHVVIFSKPPVPGHVKTRLIPTLGTENAAKLHHRLLRHTLRVVCRSVYPRSLWIAGELAHPDLLDASHEFGIGLRRQEGADLGARMKHAMQTVLAHAEATAIVGTDCPVLQEHHFDQVFGALSSGSEVAVIPAEDGGYVLIAASSGQPERRGVVLDALFDNMPWSTDQVMARTRERLLQIDARWFELPSLWDIDRPEDVARLEALLRENEPPAL
jgi:rSAM/selenodomain-associated transferase 1